LGDKKDRNTPEKVNNIPPISCVSSCNTAWNYLQIVDCEGRVWGCGRNASGQLGLGHTNRTQTFQMIETIPELKVRRSTVVKSARNIQ
jgi:alpha-tubulin suppressor-like RCC1 family protein